MIGTTRRVLLAVKYRSLVFTMTPPYIFRPRYRASRPPHDVLRHYFTLHSKVRVRPLLVVLLGGYGPSAASAKIPYAFLVSPRAPRSGALSSSIQRLLAFLSPLELFIQLFLPRTTLASVIHSGSRRDSI